MIVSGVALEYCKFNKANITFCLKVRMDLGYLFIRIF
jgi:hypothetical protein